LALPLLLGLLGNTIPKCRAKLSGSQGIELRENRRQGESGFYLLSPPLVDAFFEHLD